MRAAAADPWVDVPRVSAGELAWALLHAGYETRLAGTDHLAIVRQGVPVGYVPLHESFHPGTVRAVFRSLGISIEDFATYLDAPLL